MLVAFRVDASVDMGTGHVMRCLTLAQTLTSQGAECHFLCRAQPGDLNNHIARQGYSVHIVNAAENNGLESDEPTPRAEHNTSSQMTQPHHLGWLAASQQEDARASARILERLVPNWLIVDHYALDRQWEAEVRHQGALLMVIDDLADRPHACDLLLDQNWLGDRTNSRYIKLIPESCRCLLGPAYALLQPEYEQIREQCRPRDGRVRRILIFFGGSDPTNQTEKALDALMHPKFETLEVDVVVGANHPSPADIRTKVNTRPRTLMHQALPSLAPLMTRSDLMIGAGGGTTWERFCLGLPALVIAIADNQVAGNNSLMQAGYINFLGHMNSVSAADVAKALEKVLTAPEKLSAQSVMSKNLVSGHGARLVSKQLFLQYRAKHAS